MSIAKLKAKGRTYYKYVIQVDWDFIPPEHWIEKWKEIVKLIMRHMGLSTVEIIKHKSDSQKGLHHWIHVYSRRRLSEDELNMLSWLCGDDPIRVMINNLRIQRGVPKWNILFSKVIFRREIDEKCKRCRIRNILLSLLEEEEKHEKNQVGNNIINKMPK